MKWSSRLVIWNDACQGLHGIRRNRVGQSYPNFYAAKLGSKFVKVVLSGTGGDELFVYPWRYYRGATQQKTKQYMTITYIGKDW